MSVVHMFRPPSMFLSTPPRQIPPLSSAQVCRLAPLPPARPAHLTPPPLQPGAECYFEVDPASKLCDALARVGLIVEWPILLVVPQEQAAAMPRVDGASPGRREDCGLGIFRDWTEQRGRLGVCEGVGQGGH